MKKLSRKQVIVPMNKKSKAKFMEASNSRITNLNQALKDIKLDVIFVANKQELLSLPTK